MELQHSYIHCNRAQLTGTVQQSPQFSHTNHGRTFCRMVLSVPRLSGQCDLLPVLLPPSLTDGRTLEEGDSVTVTGQLRSYNNKSPDGPRLILSLLARTATAAVTPPCNRILLSGTVCKAPTLRRTPLGREICDVILAVNRRCGRADYLPCIAWGAVAQSTAALQVGDSMALEGRIQSRTYTKALPEGPQERTAYEVSVMRPLAAEELSCDFF
ncbi:MAG: single-stranded DNA-binding protein [Oscillospiraceae bacterium]|nr:single-stranded DNA-binding protein [Oscillospiraceae bacterium]